MAVTAKIKKVALPTKEAEPIQDSLISDLDVAVVRGKAFLENPDEGGFYPIEKRTLKVPHFAGEGDEITPSKWALVSCEKIGWLNVLAKIHSYKIMATPKATWAVIELWRFLIEPDFTWTDYGNKTVKFIVLAPFKYIQVRWEIDFGGGQIQYWDTTEKEFEITFTDLMGGFGTYLIRMKLEWSYDFSEPLLIRSTIVEHSVDVVERIPDYRYRKIGTIPASLVLDIVQGYPVVIYPENDSIVVFPDVDPRKSVKIVVNGIELNAEMIQLSDLNVVYLINHPLFEISDISNTSIEFYYEGIAENSNVDEQRTPYAEAVFGGFRLWYHFSETSGAIIDSTINHLDATLINGTRDAYGFNEYDRAISKDISNNLDIITDSNIGISGRASRSIHLVFDIRAPYGNDNIIQHGTLTDGNTAFNLRVNESNNFELVLSNTLACEIGAVEGFNNPSMISLIYDGTDIKIYYQYYADIYEYDFPGIVLNTTDTQLSLSIGGSFRMYISELIVDTRVHSKAWCKLFFEAMQNNITWAAREEYPFS